MWFLCLLKPNLVCLITFLSENVSPFQTLVVITSIAEYFESHPKSFTTVLLSQKSNQFLERSKGCKRLSAYLIQSYF